MNKVKLSELIDKAGFIRFAEDEDPNTPVDWSCDYSNEIEKLVEITVRECLNECWYDATPKEIVAAILDKFDIPRLQE
jgi:hypothetical protein